MNWEVMKRQLAQLLQSIIRSEFDIEAMFGWTVKHAPQAYRLHFAFLARRRPRKLVEPPIVLTLIGSFECIPMAVPVFQVAPGLVS